MLSLRLIYLNGALTSRRIILYIPIFCMTIIIYLSERLSNADIDTGPIWRDIMFADNVSVVSRYRQSSSFCCGKWDQFASSSSSSSGRSVATLRLRMVRWVPVKASTTLQSDQAAQSYYSLKCARTLWTGKPQQIPRFSAAGKTKLNLPITHVRWLLGLLDENQPGLNKICRNCFVNAKHLKKCNYFMFFWWNFSTMSF